jgi:phosphoglucosamine mutase
MLDHATTGDGVLTSLHLLAQVAESGRTLGELASVMTRLPQVLVNIKDVNKARVASSEELAAAVAQAESELGDTGRVLIRPSGTEPMVRVMVEAESHDQAEQIAGTLAEVVRTVCA